MALSSPKIFILFVTVLFSILYSKEADDLPKAGTKSKLELVHADFIRGTQLYNRPLKIWDGNVHVRQDSLELFCQRAAYDEQGKKIKLSGNVRLLQGKDTLLTRYLTYYEDTKKAVAEQDVRVFRPHQFLSCDYLEYYYDTDSMKVRGNLRIFDREQDVAVTGEKGEYLPSSQVTTIENNAHFWQVDSSRRDTLHIFSGRMSYHFGEKRFAEASDSVNILQQNMHASGDSAVYYLDEEVAYLRVNPRVFQDNNEMFGEQIKLIMKNKVVNRVEVSGSARALSVQDSLAGKENKLEGRKIIVYISDNRLRKLKAISNARSFYYLTEEQGEQGINTASADTIEAFFKKNEVDSIVVIGGSQGVFYPEAYAGEAVK